MTAIEAALKAIDYEKTLEHGNYVPPVYVFRAVNERNATDPFNYGYEMFLLGIAKGRRMEKVAQKQKKSAPPKILYNDHHAPASLTDYINDTMSLLNSANFREVRLVWIAANRLIDRKEASIDGEIH